MALQRNDGGILIRAADALCIASARDQFSAQAARLGIDDLIQMSGERSNDAVKFRLRSDVQDVLVPDYDTLQLCDRFHLDPLRSAADLEKEILLAMLASPVTFDFPSYAEFAASVRIRQNIVNASRLTALSFHTSKIERPADCWHYTEDSGFILLPGASLIEALRKATQPAVSGEQYSFSCYRATEYVTLLGIAQELAQSNPELLRQLELQWSSRAIKSRQFHDIFTREYGSLSEPLPIRYYVPGDRLWFRNPEERSAEVVGYEGSWVFYIGAGQFSNFWKRDQPYTLVSKCIEIYHWRSGAYQDANGNWQMNEAAVEQAVGATMSDTAEIERILGRMMRFRDSVDVSADGGCIDVSREYPRWICPGTCDLVLPENQ
jgi:hypothetical protein